MEYQRFKFLPLRAIGYRGRVWRLINSRQDRWEKQFLVLEEGALSYYADEQCALRYDSLFISSTCRIEARSDEYLGERFILKLSINNNEGYIQWSVASLEEQTSWVEALSSEISGSFPIIKQPEIWPNFTSSCLVLPSFHTVDTEFKVSDGNYIPVSKMLSPPSISLKFSNIEKPTLKNHYTFIMIDMDFTNSSECSPRQYLLWAKANISNEDGTDGEEWISYQAPSSSDKSMDAHRIFFLLLLQECRLNLGSSIVRDHFQLTQFAKLQSLLLPVGINGCFASYQITDVRFPVRTNSNISNSSSINLNEVDSTFTKQNNLSIEGAQNWSKLSPSYASHSENSYFYHVEECHEEELRKIQQKKLISVLKSPGSKSSNKKSVSFKLDDTAQPIKAPFNVSIELMLDVYAEEDDDNQPDYEIRKFSSSSESTDDVEQLSTSHSNNAVSPNTDNELISLGLKIPENTEPDNLRIHAGFTPRLQKLSANKAQSPRNNTLLAISNGKSSTYNSWIETSAAFNTLSFAEKLKRLQKPQDMCAFFQIDSTSIFIGEIVQKKYSADFLFKESFVWVNLASQTLHWAKSSIHKSDPKKQKYILLHKQGSAVTDENFKDIGNYKGSAVNVTQQQDKLIIDLEGKRSLKIKGLGKTKLPQWIFVLKCLLNQSLSIE